MADAERAERTQKGSALEPGNAELVIALAGTANVGKSAIFNQLTGAEQTVGNWPGKTVEKAGGILVHHGLKIRIVDLPGIYSLSTYSIEEIVSREYIAREHPDAVLNVVDATALERNLFFTLQLIEMGAPLAVAVNMTDVAKKRGISIDYEKMAARLGIPVFPVIATRGVGVHEAMDEAIEVASSGRRPYPIKYGAEVETRIEKIERALENVKIDYPKRWAAIKLLEGDEELTKLVASKNPRVLDTVKILQDEISRTHREPCSVVISSERYAAAARIAGESQNFSKSGKVSPGERLDALSMNGVWGYAMMFFVMLAILAFVSTVGGLVSGFLTNVFEGLRPALAGFWPTLAWDGGVVGLYAALGVALGFLLPFYIILGVLEDSGYLPRVAYLMDRPCHLVGLHGKACIPMIVGLGCNVPACVGCRIMENKRDKLIATFLSTMVPCSARTAVILGLVGVYLGFQWAVLLYVIDFALIFVVGRALNRLVPGVSVGIILEIPQYRTPSAKVVLRQAWTRFRPFLTMAVPLIVAGSVVLEGLRLSGHLDAIASAMSPVTVFWLGLPAFTGALLLIGVLRKEATLVLLASVAGTADVIAIMTPLQIFIFGFVVMVYVPCISTIAALVKEVGWRWAAAISFAEISLAVLLGGLLYRILFLFM
ncbi:MAG: ferrous iron transport protein B [Methanobacteriota archaeon]